MCRIYIAWDFFIYGGFGKPQEIAGGKPSELRSPGFPPAPPFQGTLENRVHTSYKNCVK